jgi:peptidoglycan/LPS O-acetylase OafA/YrhL
LISEILILGIIIFLVFLGFKFSSKPLRRHLVIWISLSLVMPFLHLAFRTVPEGWLLFFWPSSIGFMALGAGPNTQGDIIYMWVTLTLVNVAMYFVLGLLFYFFKSYFHKVTGNTNNET